MTDDHELTESERSTLDAWTTLTPPPGFADRVIAARGASVARRRWPLVAAGLAVAALAAVVATTLLRDPDRSARGELIAAEARTTKLLGDRAVAVAEPEATLAWRIDNDGNAEIEQRAGDVFYRVERGGSFVVHTPAGDVRVTGTCFRVEVKAMNRTKQLLLSGTMGAAIATGVVVTVYEGHVVADSRRGAREQVVAGQRATIEPDGRTVVATAGAPDTSTLPTLDTATATREQLLTRTEVQQQEIVKLRARVSELEGGSGDNETGEPGRAWYDPSPETLKAWAADCHVRNDEPGLERWQPAKTLGKNERGLEQSELPHVNAALAELQQQWKLLVRALYIEATGDMHGADTLSTEAMRKEIEEKSGAEEHSQLLQRIALERAGLAKPPVDLSKTSPFERLFRAYLELGNKTEQALAKRVGPERAKAIRGEGWGSRSNWSGCPRED